MVVRECPVSATGETLHNLELQLLPGTQLCAEYTWRCVGGMAWVPVCCLN